METDSNKNKWIAGAAIAALLLGSGGVMLGRTILGFVDKGYPEFD